MADLKMTLACWNYDRTRALMDGTVKPEGIDLHYHNSFPAATFHRMMGKHEFEASELGLTFYLDTLQEPDPPFVAIPVYPIRIFSHSAIYINTNKGIEQPKDLIGKKIGIKSFLVSAGHWMRGILEHEYGVPHKSIQWFAELDEDIEFTPHKDLNITRLPHNRSVETMLAEGELDAVIHSSIIKPILNKDPRVGRLWPDYKAEEARFFAKTGIFPIMHVMGIKQEIVDKHPWVPINMFQAFQKAKAIAMKRMNNPRIVPLAWYREVWEEQERLLGPDPWEYGLTDRNRHTLETVAGYSYEQGLTQRKWTPDELFVSVFQGRKRGDEFRI